jgi:preprotein translocase subunit SecD
MTTEPLPKFGYSRPHLFGVLFFIFFTVGALLVSLTRGDLSLGLDLRGGLTLEYRIGEEGRPLSPEDRDQVLAAVHDRLEELDLDDFSVYFSRDALIVSLASDSAEEADMARQIISAVQRLEFFRIDESFDPFPSVGALPPPLTREIETTNDSGGAPPHFLSARGAAGRERLLTFLEATPLPAGRRFALGMNLEQAPQQGSVFAEPAPSNQVVWRSYVLQGEAELDASHVSDAEVVMDEFTNRPSVLITFDDAGALLFAELTRELVGEKLAIVVNDTVMSAPLVQEQISGGRARVDMSSQASSAEAIVEAEALAVVLRAGALPMPLVLMNETQISPALDGTTLSLLLGTALLFLLIIAIVSLIKHGRAGGITALSGVACLTTGLALYGTSSMTLTLMSVSALYVTVALCMLLAAIVIGGVLVKRRENISLKERRQSGLRRLLILGLPPYIVLLVGAMVATGLLVGPLRGFFSGLFFSLCAAFAATAIVSTLALSGTFPSLRKP